MEIVICLLEEAVKQYRDGKVYVADRCLDLVVKIRNNEIDTTIPFAVRSKP